MEPRLSKSQIDKLGERLRGDVVPSAEDLVLLQEVRSQSDEALRHVSTTIATKLAWPVTGRLKTVQTIIDKLRREKTRLSTMQDIAGARIVSGETLGEQDQMVERLVHLFPGSKIVDRRARPSYGYRAVHVIVEAHRCFVEVQVRTSLQHLWAEVVEDLADQWGRQIRYGDSPGDPHRLTALGSSRQEVFKVVSGLGRSIAEYEDSFDDWFRRNDAIQRHYQEHAQTEGTTGPEMQRVLDKLESAHAKSSRALEMWKNALVTVLQGLIEGAGAEGKGHT